MALNPLISGVLDNVLESPAPGWGHHPDEGIPAPGWGHHPEVAMEDWRKPYVKKWIKHNNPNDPFRIEDKEYLKNLQDLVIFHKPI